LTTPVIPSSSEELAELITDRPKMKEIFDSPDPKTLPEFLTAYAKAANKADPDVTKQVNEGIDKAMASWLRENNAELRRPNQAKASAADVRAMRKTGTAYNKSAQGSPLDGKYATLMDFLKVIDHRADPREPSVSKAQLEIRNAMSSTDPSTGGFLIPEEFRSTLLEVALESSIVRPRATVIPMASLRAAMPMLDVTSNVSNVYGGIVAYWTEEGAALVQSQPRFAQIALEAKKLTAYTEIPNELVDDSGISVDAFVNERFPKAIANFEDRAFLAGTGVGEPLGALNPLNTALITQAIEGGQTTGTILWENIIKMYSRMLPDSLGRAVWLVPPAAFPELATMALNVGTGGSAIWLNNGQAGPPMTILGRPVIVTEKIPNLGTLGDIALVDFEYYLIGDRMAMSAKSSADYRFGNDMMAYRFIERVDGRPWIQSAITPQNGGPTLSPFVQLAARP
jgi:HK97 family phage major capsid protein